MTNLFGWVWCCSRVNYPQTVFIPPLSQQLALRVVVAHHGRRSFLLPSIYEQGTTAQTQGAAKETQGAATSKRLDSFPFRAG